MKLWKLVNHMTSSAPLMSDMYHALCRSVLVEKDITFIASEAKRILSERQKT